MLDDKAEQAWANIGRVFCKICNRPIAQRTLLRSGKVYHHCDYCDFTHLDPQFHLSLEEEKLRYDQHQNTSENRQYTEIFKCFIDTTVMDCFAPMGLAMTIEVLDYGCGPNPVLATMLQELGFITDIYDPYYAPQELAPKSYDLVTSTEVFEHLREPLETLRHIRELLKPNAYLAIMTKFICLLDEFPSWRYKDDITHISFYSPKTFSVIAQTLELDLIKHNSQDIVVLRKKA